jgi:hypothetical protein
MAKFVAPTIGIGQADLISSATPAHRIGTRAVDEAGRTFRYVKAGGTALVAGDVIQSPAIVANHLALTAPAVAVGATSFTCTPGATLGTANQYEDGFLQVSVTPGLGYTYPVAGHAAFASATAFTLNLKEPIQVALTTSSRLGLIQNKYKGVIQLPVTTATGTIVGVATYVIAASEYGWILTWGTCSVLTTGTPALGAMVLGPGTVAGAAQVVVAAGNLIVGQVIGHMAQVGVTGEANFVDVRINP